MALTLELREKDALNNYNNGDWESTLQDRVILNDGDSVIMKSCFVDTEATSNQKIVIEKDITLKMDITYFVNANIAYNTTANPDNVVDSFNSGSIPNWSPDYKKYNMCVPTPVGGATGVEILDTIRMDVNNFAKGFPDSGLIPAFSGTIKYIDINGDEQTANYSVPQFQYVPLFADKTNAVLSGAVVAKITGGDPQNPGITYVNPTYEEIVNKYFYYPEAQMAQGLGGDYFMNPIIETITLSLPTGSYSPVQLCNYLNTELTKTETDGTNLYKNKFLPKTGEGTTDETGYSREVAVINEAGNAVSGFRAKDPYSFLYGANQVEFTYLDAQQLFAIDQIHTSMYDSAGNKVVTYLPTEGEILKAYSQIGFTHLSAVDSDGNNYDFWEEKMGFDLSKLILGSTLTASENVGYMGNANVDMARFPFLSVESGVNLTEDLASIDGLIKKTGDFYEPIGEENATSDVNTRIPAETSVFGKADQFGYFLIEVRANMGGEFLTSDSNIPSIRAVVSRYYEQNAYVSGSEGDSVIYTHRGEPVFLDSFKCRVLDSGRNLATNIGDDNTIFLQVIRKE